MKSILIVAALLTFAAGAARACDLPHPPGWHLSQEKALFGPAETASSYRIGPALSGAWFDPQRSGEGIILQMLPDGRALAIWFTYPAAGEAGEQAWLIAEGGRIEGDRLRFEQVLRPQGGRFGEAFDPASVDYTAWGSLELRFTGCNGVELQWSGPPAFGSGSRALTRLSAIDETGCEGPNRLTASGGRAFDSLRARSGAWFVPSRAGEGWIIEDLADGQSLLYWFTFDSEGRQAWVVGSGARNGTALRIDNALIGGGTRFGAAFAADQVELRPWGRLEFDFSSCDSATISYQSSLPGFGSATRSAQRLTRLAGAPCLDAPPAATTALAWTESTRMPTPWTSELAVTTMGDALYALGGFGNTRSFRRRGTQAGSWSALPPLPAGRDHLAAFAVDGGVYMIGGAPNGEGDQSTAAFRFDTAQSRWEPVPQLGYMFGSHAAVLHGRAFIGNFDATLQEFDPRSREVFRIAPGSVQERDHAQVLAFLDEIWVVAGRTPETLSVDIYNPASRRWREGPYLNRRRGGFAAAVVGARIVVAGGEVISGRPYVEASSEIYAAGAEAWQLGPDLPHPVHGTAGGALGNRFVVVSGSPDAGSIENANGRVYELVLPAQ